MKYEVTLHIHTSMTYFVEAQDSINAKKLARERLDNGSPDENPADSYLDVMSTDIWEI